MAKYVVETNEDQDDIIDYVVQVTNSNLSKDLWFTPEQMVNQWIEVMVNNYRDDALQYRRDRIIEAYESLPREERASVNSRLGIDTRVDVVSDPIPVVEATVDKI